MAGPLTDNQTADYRERGFLAPLDLLDGRETAALRARLEALEAAHADGGLPRRIGSYLRVNAHLAMEMPLEIARRPALLDRVESILGPDLMLWSAEFFIKEPRSVGIVSWHQDLTYWGMDGSDHEVTAWLALSPATAAAGCMRFVPGSHRQQIVSHRDTFAADNLLSRGQEIAVEVDAADAVAAELQPGQFSLHHGRLFHASGPNTTDDRRIGLVFRFIRPDTPATGRNLDYAVLLRGCDRTRNRINIVSPPGDFTGPKLRLYEEVVAAQTATLSDGAGQELEMYGASA